MKNARNSAMLRGRQEGALIVLTLLILLVISLLGMSSVDTTGLEMKMSSNSREQQAAFEAAEYTLSWVENALVTTGYFTDAQVTNGAVGGSCGSVCFTATGTNGYYYNGTSATAAAQGTCVLTPPALEPYADPATWTTANRRRTLVIPNTGITAMYIIEYWCYQPANPANDMSDVNRTRTYRITAYAVSASGRARAMLRSVVRQ